MQRSHRGALVHFNRSASFQLEKGESNSLHQKSNGVVATCCMKACAPNLFVSRGGGLNCYCFKQKGVNWCEIIIKKQTVLVAQIQSTQDLRDDHLLLPTLTESSSISCLLLESSIDHLLMCSDWQNPVWDGAASPADQQSCPHLHLLLGSEAAAYPHLEIIHHWTHTHTHNCEL